jgi:hypothetical protein
MAKAWLVNIYKRLKAHKRYVFLLTILAILIILFNHVFKSILIITILGIAATYSTMYKKIFQAPPAFELITLTTVAVAIFFGPTTGILYAIVVSLSSEIASQALDPFSITYIFPRIVCVFACRALYGGGTGPLANNLPLLGLLMSLLYNLLQQPVYTYLTDIEKRIKSLYFSILNIPLNFLIFKFLGVPLFALLSMIAH